MRWLRRIDDLGWPLIIVRLVLAYMFISMGWEKAWHPEAFIKLIREYEMVPDSAYLFLNAVGVVLPWLEITCGVALLLGVMVRGAAALLAINPSTLRHRMRKLGIDYGRKNRI